MGKREIQWHGKRRSSRPGRSPALDRRPTPSHGAHGSRGADRSRLPIDVPGLGCGTHRVSRRGRRGRSRPYRRQQGRGRISARRPVRQAPQAHGGMGRLLRPRTRGRRRGISADNGVVRREGCGATSPPAGVRSAGPWIGALVRPPIKGALLSVPALLRHRAFKTSQEAAMHRAKAKPAHGAANAPLRRGFSLPSHPRPDAVGAPEFAQVCTSGGTGLGLTRRGTESSTKRGPAEPAPSWWNSGMLLALSVRCSCSTLNSRCPSRERFLPYKLSIQIGVPGRRGLSATHAAMQADAMLDKGDLDGRAAPAGDRRCSWGPERPAMAA